MIKERSCNMVCHSVLIASAVRKQPEILSEFLLSLDRLEHTNLDISYCFIDDNEDVAASDLLSAFDKSHNNCVLLEAKECASYADWEREDHTWSMNKIDKIATLKNQFIAHCLANSFTHIFFIDADLVLHPKTLNALIDANHSIVSNIFWTRWEANARPLPHVI